MHYRHSISNYVDEIIASLLFSVKKSAIVMPKPTQIISIVSTESCLPFCLALFSVEYDKLHFWDNLNSDSFLAAANSSTRAIVFTLHLRGYYKTLPTIRNSECGDTTIGRYFSL